MLTLMMEQFLQLAESKSNHFFNVTGLKAWHMKYKLASLMFGKKMYVQLFVRHKCNTYLHSPSGFQPCVVFSIAKKVPTL